MKIDDTIRTIAPLRTQEKDVASPWERHLAQWLAAGLLDTETAARIRAFEAGRAQGQTLRWPVLLAISLGGLLLGAGVLLFVAAHWDSISPAGRFALVLALVALFHLAAGVTANRFGPLATVLHAVGTVSLGAGIFLTGQIFHLQEHWPGGVMLWALGAWLAWLLLRDWPQLVLAALLTPLWLAGEWIEATHDFNGRETILTEGLLLLAVSYLSATLPEQETPMRKALTWLGAMALIPAAWAVVASTGSTHHQLQLTLGHQVCGRTVALALPLLLAWLLRGRLVWWNLLACAWVVAAGELAPEWHWRFNAPTSDWRQLLQYALCALGAVGLMAWGLREARKERINLGIAGFALTVLTFYFSSVMDKLGRSASLIGLGLLFLGGGWLLEKTRRRLLARLETRP